jgi:tetratricopeptide (TPR) repeat protein
VTSPLGVRASALDSFIMSVMSAAFPSRPPVRFSPSRFLTRGDTRAPRRPKTTAWLLAVAGLVALAGCDMKGQQANEAFNRGLNHYKNHELEKAVAAYDESIALDPNDATVYFNRGICHHELHHFDQAVRDYTDALRLNPSFAEAYAERSESYIALDQNIKAKADIEKAKQLNPNIEHYEIPPQVIEAEKQAAGKR